MPRHDENRTGKYIRMGGDTYPALQKIAAKLGYDYNGTPSVGKMLDAIALGQIILSLPLDNQE